MLVFILFDVQYLHNDAFSFENGLIHQNHSLNSHNPIKSPPSKIPLSLSLLSIWKTLINFKVFIVSTIYMLIMICLKLTYSFYVQMTLVHFTSTQFQRN